MKRSFGKFVTIGLGMLCSVLLFVAGVLALTTREMSFGIQVNVSSNILVQVDMSLDNGSTYTTIFNNAKTAVPTSSTVNSYATLTGNTVSLDTQNANSPFLNLNLKSQDSFIFKITNFTTSQYVSDATTYPNGPSLMATATATSIQGSIIKQYVYDQTTAPINGVQNIKPFTNGANASTAESKNLTLNFGVSQSALVRVNLDLTLKNYADKEITTQLENITSSNTYSFSRLTVDTYTTTLIPATNMALPAELEIYVGATLLTAGVDYVYNNSSGVLTINNTTATQTTGNISIKAKAKPQNVSVKYNLATGTTALLNTTTFTNGQTASVQVSSTQDFSTTIIAQGNKQIAYVVKVDGIALAKGVSFANGTLTVSNEVITGNLEIIASGVEVWDGVMPTANLSYTFSGGSGTELDPYQIATATDLAYLSSNVSGGTDYSLGVYYKQTADILLNNYFMSFDTASGLVLVKNASGGDVCCIGTGINGTIYNTSTAGTMGTIYTSAAATGTLSTTTAPADLYSWTAIGYDATGKYFKGTFDGNNYTISGMYINTTSGFQGLFGYSSGAKVQNVGVVNGYVKGAINVGGVVGNASTNAIIINCRNDGTVIGSSFRIGGIAGQMHTNSIINNCYNTGEITGDYDIGGIAGSNATTSIVSNCYNIGAISGTSSVGALVGTNASGCTISYSYYLDGTTAVGTQSGTISNLATFTNTTEAKSLLLNNLNTWVSTNNANGDYSPWVADTEVVNSGYPLLAEEWENVVDSAYAGGAGTSVDPYQIANADQLKYFANQVNIGTDYAQTYFILTGHILINNTSNLANWGTQAPSYSWSPIGNVNNPFNGVFDGNGFTVSGIYINNSSFSYSGLFGNVSGGTVLNVGVSASYIKGRAYVGGVVGMAKNSAKVANCYSNATVYGGQYVGGVAGYVNNSTVANCYFAGSLTGSYSKFGGGVGYLTNSSTLANCYNSGYVTNKSSLSTAKFGGVLGEKAITAT
ncbi:MAG: GLUG motif-containing protein, partial [Clostridia bacterium]|nr:GLUG motif-containing protein [Clostridia bacterium]